MTERAIRTVYVGVVRGHHFPDDVEKFIAKIREMYEAVPIEYRDTAKIEMEAVEDYDCHYAEIDICYRRPETDGEMKSRGFRIANQKKHDLEVMKRLMEKYKDDL